MRLERKSPCKVNLLLNILGKRSDGFHELETVMHPVDLCDRLELERKNSDGIELTCTRPDLPTDSNNLIHRAAARFFAASGVKSGIRIHLEKNVPLAAGLGGGSSNAAATLLGLNETFGFPLAPKQLTDIAAGLGSDIPFFLQSRPALATGRGERITPLDFFPALNGVFALLIYPGFGISTAWAYQQLGKFPVPLNGESGRAQRLIAMLQTADLRVASSAFYNSLEAPALHKYPILAMIQEFLREHGAAATLMSGSGSTTFALIENEDLAKELVTRFTESFGHSYWLAVVPLRLSRSDSA